MLHHRIGDLEKMGIIARSFYNLHHRIGDLENPLVSRRIYAGLHHRIGDLEINPHSHAFNI